MSVIDGLRLVGPPGSNKVMAGELSRLVRRAMGGFRLSEPRVKELVPVVVDAADEVSRRLGHGSS